ncbi:hypothetical protein AOH328_00390 [Helicobacter pylori]
MKNENQKTVELINPIVRGEKEFKEIIVLKPTVPALKGLKMLDVLQMDVDALQVLLPRITQPMLHKNDFINMEVDDFTDIATVAIGFLGKKSATEADDTETNPQ